MTLPADALARKGTPINSGVLRFFPAAIAGVARVSVAGSKQHGNAGLYDDRSKSNDDLDALQRHLTDSEIGDGMDGDIPHVDKVVWRALRHCQKWHEARGKPLAPAAVLPPAGVVDHTLAAAYLRDVAERDDDAPDENAVISGFDVAKGRGTPIRPGQSFQFYADPDALQYGAVTTPAGAQSGEVVDASAFVKYGASLSKSDALKAFAAEQGVVDVTRAAYVPNWVDQQRDGS